HPQGPFGIIVQQVGQQQSPSGFSVGSGKLAGQETTLPHAFTTGTLQDPAPGNWNMDTGASSHLNDSVNNLSDVLIRAFNHLLQLVTGIPFPLPTLEIVFFLHLFDLFICTMS
ncbi:hypothetical protein Tco_0306251, partial [Tanacetum coccineum]